MNFYVLAISEDLLILRTGLNRVILCKKSDFRKSRANQPLKLLG